MKTMIEIKNLTKSFGSFLAVNKLNFEINKGEILGFLGPNGAGKTTTMRMITGFIKPSYGEVIINGLNLKDKPELCKKFIGYVPEGSPLYQEMTTLDFLKFVARIRNISRNKINYSIENVIKLLNLQNVLYKKIEGLSKGYKRRVGLAQSIIHDPEILILDEPTDGLDPNQKSDVRKLIKKLGRDKAIIISTHILEEVNALCNRAMIISNGKLLLDEKPKDILKKSDTYNSVYLLVEEKSVSELKKEIIKNGISKSPTILNGFCVIKIRNNNNVKKKLDNFIKKKKYTLKHYEIAKGSLEEVFRRLTYNA